MKNLVLVVVFVTVVIFFSSTLFCQEIDSLILPTSCVAPGDTAVIALYLSNQSFTVGALSAKIMLADSIQAKFVEIQRGEAIDNFALFNTSFTEGSLRLNTFANWPNYDPVPPLPLGYHEIAVLEIAVDNTVEIGTRFSIYFDNSSEYLNMISDSSGYMTVEPYTVDGVIIVDPYSEIGVDQPTPVDFVLHGNYPNPFNASTNIGFAVEQPGHVLLEVYDILGKRVAILFDSYVSSGTYNIIWNGVSDNNQPLSSGLYFYRLTSDGKSMTKKMSLIK